MHTLNQILLHTRAGFESECGQEIMDLAQDLGIYGYIKTKDNDARVHFICANPQDSLRLIKELDFRQLIFTRQWFACSNELSNLPTENRVTPILEHIKALSHEIGDAFGYLSIETADTNAAKQTLTFCKKFTSPLSSALKKQGLLQSHNKKPHLHVLFLTSSECYIGVSYPYNHSPHFMGIPRLKMPSQAPSRSTLKLEEAWLSLLTPKEREQYLQPGMRAVDLGAAPGGWTWQFVERSIHVTAIDNGPMQESLMDSGLVTHLMEDGFTYLPDKKVHWLVCDMVEQPKRVIQLMGNWILQDKTQYAIFNLKLPMKKRYQEIQLCIEALDDLLQDTPYDVRIKQLYHDREEVTVFLQKL